MGNNEHTRIVTDCFGGPTKRVKRKTIWVSLIGTISAVTDNINIIRILHSAPGTTQLDKAVGGIRMCRRTTQRNKTSVQSSNKNVNYFFLVEKIVEMVALKNVHCARVYYNRYIFERKQTVATSACGSNIHTHYIYTAAVCRCLT